MVEVPTTSVVADGILVVAKLLANNSAAAPAKLDYPNKYIMWATVHILVLLDSSLEGPGNLNLVVVVALNTATDIAKDDQISGS